MKAIILLSGGLDSTVMLAIAVNKGRQCLALSFNYNQRHAIELQMASQITAHYHVMHKALTIDPATFSKSSLINASQVPKDRNAHQIQQGGIPNTYVPGRNTIFLAYAVGQAEMYEADEIYFGCNQADTIGYPDTRPLYVEAFQNMINQATKQAVESRPPQLVTPLIKWNKKDIIKQGLALKAPLHLTMSCYDPTLDGIHCGRCDACYLRKEGFFAASQVDPTKYVEAGLPLEAVEMSNLV